MLQWHPCHMFMYFLLHFNLVVKACITLECATVSQMQQKCASVREAVVTRAALYNEPSYCSRFHMSLCIYKRLVPVL